MTHNRLNIFVCIYFFYTEKVSHTAISKNHISHLHCTGSGNFFNSQNLKSWNLDYNPTFEKLKFINTKFHNIWTIEEMITW